MRHLPCLLSFAIVTWASAASASPWLDRLVREQEEQRATVRGFTCERAVERAGDPGKRLAAAREAIAATADVEALHLQLQHGLDLQCAGVSWIDMLVAAAITERAVERIVELAPGDARFGELAPRLDALLAAQPSLHDAFWGEARWFAGDAERPASFAEALTWEASIRIRKAMVAACPREATPGACLDGVLARPRGPVWSPISAAVEAAIESARESLRRVVRSRAVVHALRLAVAVCTTSADRDALLAPPALGLPLELVDEGDGAWRVAGPKQLGDRTLLQLRCPA